MTLEDIYRQIKQRESESKEKQDLNVVEESVGEENSEGTGFELPVKHGPERAPPKIAVSSFDNSGSYGELGKQLYMVFYYNYIFFPQT